MIPAILTCDSEIVSARKLNLPVTTTPKNLPNCDDVLVIRWGTSKRREDGTDYHHVLNPAEAIELNVDKPASLQTMADHVMVPHVYTRVVPRGIKAVIRPMTHQHGENFSIVTGPYSIPSGHYAKAWIASDKEYRCWFFGQKTLAAKRVPMAGQVSTGDVCRSGWGYSFMDSDQAPMLRQQTLEAAQALGLNFGAADVIWRETPHREYVFLEMNTAPSLDHDKVLTFFKRGITEAME